MATTIITKNTSFPGVVPSSGQLVQGELAVNVADKKLYTLDAANNVVLIASGADYDVPVTIDANSASAALRITQIGAGNALLVEDSANPDSTPFVVTSSGNVGIGDSSPSEKLVVSGNTTISGNLSFIGTGLRITGDFSNGTISDRLTFQTNATNSNSIISAIPSGSGTQSSFVAAGNSTPTNASYIQMLANGTTDTRIISAAFGSGTNLPMAFYAGGSERVRISTAGGFSVGTTSDPGAGAIYATGNVTAFFSSDRAFKENIRDIPDALNKACAIGGKLFDWTDEYIKKNGGADGYFVQKADFGVIAQDVESQLPVAVRKRDDGTLAVDYEKMCSLAFAAIAELRAEVEALKKGV